MKENSLCNTPYFDTKITSLQSGYNILLLGRKTWITRALKKKSLK